MTGLTTVATWQALGWHIVQSTVFVLLAALLTLAFRRNDAKTRFTIWLAASIKFLIPFAPLVSLGTKLGWRIAPAGAPFLFFFPDPNQVATASAAHLFGATSAVSRGPDAGYIFASVWLAGFVTVLLRWRSEWLQARRSADSSAVATSGPAWDVLRELQLSAKVGTPIVLRLSKSACEPCVFGVWRITLILPEAILRNLSQPEIRTILSHELSHVRRRDNLSAAIHMVSQAAFWFHPLVWWLGIRMVNERERACDECVLQNGSDPLVYAQSILSVCRACVTSSAICVSGVASADIRTRLDRIANGTVGRKPGRAKRAMLRVSLLIAVVTPFLSGLLFVPRGNAQPTPVLVSALPAFDVASVKPSDPNSHLNIDFAPGGRLVVTHATLRFLIKIAYDLGDDQILAGPAWLNSRRFDVEGKPARSLGGEPQTMTDEQKGLFHEQIRLRLQRLLGERFGLEFRSESKPMPTFALIVAKNGSKLKRSSGTGDPQMNFGHGVLQAKNVDMATFARFLAEGQTGRPVSDATALTDKFDFRLEWSPDPSLNPATPDSGNGQSPADIGGTSIFTALQQQLGLKLDPRTSPANCIVVTRAELPTAN